MPNRILPPKSKQSQRRESEAMKKTMQTRRKIQDKEFELQLMRTFETL